MLTDTRTRTGLTIRPMTTDDAEAAGIWTIQSGIFTDNPASFACTPGTASASSASGSGPVACTVSGVT